MKYIEELNIDNKKVILRLDLNVTIKDNVILDDTKIKKSIPTIKYLLNRNANILIMSHLGKIKSEDDKKSNSLKIVADRLSELLELDINFIPNTRGSELENSIKVNRITMMENTRFEDYPNKLESSCDESLSQYWASLGDLFINDAFGTTHRCHASNYGIKKYVESGYGFLIKEEINGLSPIIDNVEHPFSVVMGGAKVDDKIALIEAMLKECDYLLVGGGIANTFLKAKGINIGDSLYSSLYVEKIKSLINLYPSKIIIPVDAIVSDNGTNKEVNLEDISSNAKIYDIGSKTIDIYKDILSKSSTIFINGTVGLYEEDAYKNGTEKLYQALSHIDAIKIAGGGDALASINKLGFDDDFDYLSTGGGATLEYIANKKINCFEE